jgi:hypothetical protein
MSKNNHASNNLFSYIGSISNLSEMNNFDQNYHAIYEEYNNSPAFYLLSSIDVGPLESFRQWTPEALSNKEKLYPLLVSKMLLGDIFALSIFDNLHKADHKLEYTLSYRTIHENSDLNARFKQYGGAEDSRASLSAEYWLESSESAELMKLNLSGQENLCEITGMMHIHNDNIVC